MRILERINFGLTEFNKKNDKILLLGRAEIKELEAVAWSACPSKPDNQALKPAGIKMFWEMTAAERTKYLFGLDLIRVDAESHLEIVFKSIIGK